MQNIINELNGGIKMLKTLFEAIDEKVLTNDLKESLEVQFNEAVELKALTLAEELAAEKIQEAVDSISEKAESLEAKYTEELAEAKKEFASEIEMLIESVDKYLDKVVEEFVAEAKETLAESAKSEKADLIIEALSAMMVTAGVEVSTIVEAKETSDVENKLKESIKKYDSLIEELFEKDNKINELIKIGVISEMKEGLSLIESEKFEKLAEIVNFSKDEAYLAKLNTLKESVKSISSNVTEVEEKIEESVKRSASIDKRFI
jgi:hypothetical protein